MTKQWKLDDINAYKKASELSDFIYKIIAEWSWFDKRTLGSQFIDAIDSIAANIAEGFGRYHKKDKIKFYYNSRGSVFESAYWTKKAEKRKLMSTIQYEKIMIILRTLPQEINNLISLTYKNLKK